MAVVTYAILQLQLLPFVYGAMVRDELGYIVEEEVESAVLDVAALSTLPIHLACSN